ncbi:sensor histidine kinase [Streptomyces sp. NPDC086091]|uniref:sensor histidine kinase n=1 Tax=Streptomyces sp. NPDC086091 TaxID=3365751 RepID=UPI0037FD0494
MCRQVFGFRLAMIALAAPAALLNASPGLGVRLVGAAVVVTFMGSYVLYRDWERFGPLLLRHPALLVADTLLGSLPLISAGPQSSLAYVSVCTPLLAGIVYGWRGAACFASLQALILLVVQAALHEGPAASPAERLLLPGFCVITGAVGSTLRTLLLRYGTATQALTSVRTRLAVTEAIAAERARLAREMHDSVAKTLHGLALTADSLAHSAASTAADPVRLRQQAELVARAARRAAAESRAVLTDLRAKSPAAPGVDVLGELEARAAAFAMRTGRRVACGRTGGHPAPLLPPAVARHLLAITAEALDNAHRHADPTRVDVEAAVRDGVLRISVRDDGRGLPPGTTLDGLRQDGHFGLVGMVERAAVIGARIRIGPLPGTARRADADDAHADETHARRVGTEVSLELPLPPTDLPPPATACAP